MRSVSNLIRHELIGLGCEVVKASNVSLVGLKGKVIDETMKTLVIKTSSSRKTVQKKGTTFSFSVGGETSVIEGADIVSRPEDRIKKRIRKW